MAKATKKTAKKAAPKRAKKETATAKVAALRSAGELETKIVSLFEVNALRKDAERNETDLKEWFKEQAKGQPTDFRHENIVVSVAEESREGWDDEKLRSALGERVVEFRKPITYTKVTVRKVEEAA